MGGLSIDQFGPALEELGISPEALDASDLELGAEEESTEAISEEAETEPEEIETEDPEESLPEGEEKATPEEAPATEVVEEKTAKEIQEIEAQKSALEAERVAFQEERQRIETEFITQHSEKLKTHDEFDAFLTQLASDDAELFELLQEKYRDHTRAFSNPVVENLRKQQAETAQALNEIKQRFSDEATRIKYDSQLNQVKSTIGKEAEELGVKVDWKAVESAWADNPKLGLEEALYAKYGGQMAKAAASKAKVAAVEKKIQSRPSVSTAGQVNRSATTPARPVPSDPFEAVKYFARQLKN
jgi:succinate dehydrogenase flavin-adding protein (antitoxin of CptAB toxin-antitoxin module)